MDWRPQAADLSHDANGCAVDIIGGLRAPFTVGASARVHLRPMAPVNVVTSKSAAFAHPCLTSPVRYAASIVKRHFAINRSFVMNMP